MHYYYLMNWLVYFWLSILHRIYHIRIRSYARWRQKDEGASSAIIYSRSHTSYIPRCSLRKHNHQASLNGQSHFNHHPRSLDQSLSTFSFFSFLPLFQFYSDSLNKFSHAILFVKSFGSYSTHNMRSQDSTCNYGVSRIFPLKKIQFCKCRINIANFNNYHCLYQLDF